MKNFFNINKFAVIIYWVIFLALAGMFFTNDFGLVDIHKTSIITAIGIDNEGEEVKVTAEIAMPQPSQSGENIRYAQVQGSGLTIADALNEINSKTGFYTKLQFCRLILIGENCRDNQLFRVLGCLYRKNYSELTALVAMCEGKAADMLANKSQVSDMTSEAIRKILSDEIEKSGNANTANLKDIALAEFSHSRSCFMPYVQITKPGTSEEGGNGDNVGGDPVEGGGSGESGGQGGGSGGQGQSGGQGGQSGQSGQSSNQQGQSVEFTARKTVYFSNGLYKGILDEQQSFALAMFKSKIRLAVLPCEGGDIHHTIGLRNVEGDVGVKVENGVPKISFSFSATAQIQGARVKVDPSTTNKDDNVDDKVLRGAEEELKKRFESLFSVCKESNCDILGLKEYLYKHDYNNYGSVEKDFYSVAETEYKINVRSVH